MMPLSGGGLAPKCHKIERATGEIQPLDARTTARMVPLIGSPTIAGWRLNSLAGEPEYLKDSL